MRLFIEMLRDILLGKNLVILNIFNKGVKGKDNNLNDTNRVQMGGGAIEKKTKKDNVNFGNMHGPHGYIVFFDIHF